MPMFSGVVLVCRCGPEAKCLVLPAPLSLEKHHENRIPVFSGRTRPEARPDGRASGRDFSVVLLIGVYPIP